MPRNWRKFIIALGFTRRLRAFIRQLMSGELNAKILRYHLVEKLQGYWRRDRDDDFNWSRYTMHYEGELELAARTRSLVIQPDDYAFSEGRLVQTSSKLPLHPNVHAIFETILQLRPESVLEVGCGGGDNLHNLRTLQPSLDMRGIDVSTGQLQLLYKRHPALVELVIICDVTGSVEQAAPADLVFTNAVLMHIGAGGGRWECAVRNLFRLARHHVLLVEHWTKHEYVMLLKSLVPGKDIPWPALYLYSRASHSQEYPRVLVASRHPLPYEPLHSSDRLFPH